MKIIIIAALLVFAAEAKQFSVKKAGKTCALLTVDGSLKLTANQGGKLVSTTTLQFSDAKVLDNSTCEIIKLTLTDNDEFWFQFDDAKGKWQVVPITEFVPADVFDKGVNDTAPVSMQAQPLAPSFDKKVSYMCKAEQTFEFAPESSSQYNYSASAVVTGFQIQSVVSETFVKGYDCPADVKPTPKDYSCKDGNKTMIIMDGNFTLTISYNKTGASKVENATQTITVPGPDKTTMEGSVCKAGANSEVLVINFFDTWALRFDFTKDKDYYSIANMSVTYSYDSHLPNNTGGPADPITVDLVVGKDYLKASNKGYYICNANLNKGDNHGVTLSSKNFKYRAFDSDNKGFNGDISECSADESSNSVVPIAVGAALAGLVVIVLIAYLIGRKRSRKTGYESV